MAVKEAMYPRSPWVAFKGSHVKNYQACSQKQFRKQKQILSLAESLLNLLGSRLHPERHKHQKIHQGSVKPLPGIHLLTVNASHLIKHKWNTN